MSRDRCKPSVRIRRMRGPLPPTVAADRPLGPVALSGMPVHRWQGSRHYKRRTHDLRRADKESLSRVAHG